MTSTQNGQYLIFHLFIHYTLTAYLTGMVTTPLPSQLAIPPHPTPTPNNRTGFWDLPDTNLRHMGFYHTFIYSHIANSVFGVGGVQTALLGGVLQTIPQLAIPHGGTVRAISCLFTVIPFFFITIYLQGLLG
ncbi:hypothetical protein GGR51DRAFT_474014 [Nemania sp. FL0031]|nr:hypothetical protein GGR51DRAFT_474014 [Nemania sp. FL0031]